MIKTVLFDIGGVLITPSEKVTPYILSQIYSVGIDVTLSAYNNSLSQLRTGSKKIADLAREIGSAYPVGTNIADNIEQIYMDYYKKQALIDKDMMKFIGKLKEKYYLVALSNMLDLHVRCNRERGLFDFFQKSYLSSLTGMVKPDEGSFRQVFDDTGINPSETVFIEDNEKNIDVAKNLGIIAYKYDTLLNLRAFLEKYGVV